MKISTVAVIMTIVATVTVANRATNVANMEEISTIHSRCPPNVTADFYVNFYSKDSQTVKGCATLEFRSHHDSNEMKVFIVRFGRLINSVCVSGNYGNVNQLVFSCRSHSEFDNKKVYSLNGHDLDPTGKYQTRCVMYKMTNSVMNLMAVSGTSSCQGLIGMIFYSQATPPKGSMLMRLNKPKDNPRHGHSTSEDENSTQLNLSGPRYYINSLLS